jgi:hypothetical protein
MKTTIKLSPYKRITVEPNKAGQINLEVICGMVGQVTTSELHVLTPDQAGVLCFALEVAAIRPRLESALMTQAA